MISSQKLLGIYGSFLLLAFVAGCSGGGTVPTTPVITITPSSLTFANTNVGATSAPLTLTVTNSGNGTGTLTSLTVTGTGSSSFAAPTSGNNCGSSLAASSSCNVAVVFTPTTVGTLSASFSVTDNAANSPQTVTLTGTGTAPAVSLSPTSLTFPNTPAGSTSAGQTATITNSGTGPLTITSVAVAGTSFVISTNTCGASLAAGANCAVTVAFQPTTTGALAGTLNVVDNASGSPHTVALSGTGTTPSVSFSPGALTFANTQVGSTSAALTTTLTNTGTSALTISSVSLTGLGNASFAITANTCGASLAAAASCAVTLVFQPAVTGTVGASLTFADNASGSPHSVTLSGTGVAASVSVSPTALAFASTMAGSTSPTLSTTITNTGVGAVSLTSLTLGGANPGSFAIFSNGCGSTLAAGANCAVTLVFKPLTVAPLSATLLIADNATGSPQSVALSGTGTTPPSLTASPATLDFGLNRINSTAQLQETITNTSSLPVTISNVSISGTNASNFAVANNACGTTLAAGSNCLITVSYNPSATLTYGATLNFTNNALGSAQTATLMGKAAPEPVSCTGTSLTSPSQPAPTPNYAGTAFSGKVMAGSLPVIGASVQIYAAGRTGNGSAPTAMLGTALTTDSTGAFSVPSSFVCPYSNSVLYAVARGGKAGSTGTANAGIVLSSVIGLCNSITGSPSFMVNEVTTATTAWSMQQFMAAGAQIGAVATNSNTGIVLAAGTFKNLVNPLSGTAPGTAFPSTGTAPTAKINQLANLLNACIVSSGATSTACTQLYSLTATTAGTPSNTLDAALNLVKNPGTNVGALYTLSTSSTAYAPVLSSAPADWMLFVTYAGGGMSDPSAVAIDSVGRVWVGSYFFAASLFTNTGSPVFPTGITGNNLYNTYGAAVDVNDIFWAANEQSIYPLNTGLGTVTQLNSGGSSPNTFSAGGFNFPISVAFDTSGVSWVVDYGNSHLTVLNGAGAPLSGATGYTTSQYIFPVAGATDSKCNVYVANQSSDTVTFTSLDGTMYGSFEVGAGPSGLAVDAADNVWTANYYGDSVGWVNSAGVIKSGTGIVGGGTNHPQGIAIDGVGNVWVANYRGPSLTQIAGASSSAPGTPLSPAAGWGPDAALLEAFGIAIDSGGSIWVSNFGSNTLTQFVGVAAPVKTPLLGTVRVP